MFYEVWSSVREHFHDEEMGGIDWDVVRTRYEPLLPRLGCRRDLTDLLQEMCGELGSSHMDVSHPPTQDKEAQMLAGDCRGSLGFLGADAAWDAICGGYKVQQLVRGDVWSQKGGGPLARARIPEGARLMAINRMRLGLGVGPEQLLTNAADRDVFLTFGTAGKEVVGPKSKGNQKKRKKQNAKSLPPAPPTLCLRTVRVHCASLEVERLARYRDWVDGQTELVHARSGGRVGYVHVPSCEPDGFAHFYRFFLTECLHEALILDVRGNEGGFISEMLLDRLMRSPFGVRVPRVGRGGVYTYPVHCLRSARKTVLLVDSGTCSDAEILAASFRDLGLGTIVGTRTWGGVLSVGNLDMDLVDGGRFSVPFENCFSLAEGSFALENHGLEPDIQVEIPPDWREPDSPGPDPQLQCALQEAHRLLEASALDAAAVFAQCRSLPQNRAHLRWRVDAAPAA